jgi:hypothetical protein
MEASKILVILVLLFVILVLFINQLEYKERFFDSTEEGEEEPDETIHEIKYHILTDFIPEINGIKYYNYLSKNNILRDFNSEISPGNPISCTLVEESIEKNLTYHFTDLQDRTNTVEAVKNEINSTALILHNLKRRDIEYNNDAKDVLKFTLLNMLDHYSLNRDPTSTVHIVFLPFLLNDETLLEFDCYKKRIYFIGLYKPSDNSIFLNNVPKWSGNDENIDSIKEMIYNDISLFASVRFHDEWTKGIDKKCDFLTDKCKAGVDCHRLNKIMKTNIQNNYDQQFAHTDYKLDEEREENLQLFFTDNSENRVTTGCPLNQENSDNSREIANTFSFI